jgi:acyl-CoA thioesterase
VNAEYDRDIQVNAVSGQPGVGGEYAAELSAGWIVGGGVNGGYLLATIGNAIRATVPGKPDPFSISAYYLSASTPGPATITTRVKRDGGSVATVAAELAQGDDTRISALASFGDLAALPDHVETTAVVPDLPPREQCVPNSMAPDEMRTMAPMMDRFEMLFHPGHIGWAVGAPTGQGVISAWFRLKDGREPDPISLLTIVDLLPPVTFDLGRPGWAPTLELTAHVRAVPAPGWLRVRHATRNVAGGMFEEDCEIWDSADRLVAQSRQLARLPRG